MRKLLFGVAALVAMASFVGRAQAVETLIYGFEDGVDGFSGLGFPGTPTPTQDTIGATQLLHSLKYSTTANGTFTGILSQNFDPLVLGNPPGVNYVLVDVTIPDGGAFTGNNADLGVVIYGSRPQDGIFGAQAQFTDFEPLGGKAAGTYHDVRIDLDHAIQFGGQSFNDVFGTTGAVAPKLAPSGFEFFLQKSSDAPITFYIDNVRLGSVPEPASFALLGLGAMGLVSMGRRKR